MAEGREIADRTSRGEPIEDDSFLLLFNAHYEDMTFTLPARRFGAEWIHEICTYEPALEPGRLLVFRPHDVHDLPHHDLENEPRLTMRPGLTGLWQVSGRSGTTYSKRVACDTYYARNWSMILDARIIVATISVLLDSDNAY